ncbi:hypothetical protein K4L44_11095 [Halosquirtibacter laminarini]|uniref:Uncharacterized protein n=1 Tax=Halosquirtibacter laminarini TaxID=3374600 RepID=A0AC61NCC1_9BACT|nr:hypothetical protein K4L44_11095 [Prolixibacteraceae bacterium]
MIKTNKVIGILAIMLMLAVDVQAKKVIKIVTTVESIVPMGIGRSRIIEEKSEISSKNLTTDRKDGKKSSQKDVSRKAIKVKKFDETKLLNFYSMTGINFQNIASNDAVISDKLTNLLAEGWELLHVTSAVESDSGDGDHKGIFVTRFILVKDIED